jgi:mRNA-degrading endonuclease RelE of RelBE toxin-antitoxin system
LARLILKFSQVIMNLALSETFFSALRRLPEELAAKVEKAIGLYRHNPKMPGLNLEKLRKSNLCSIRVDDSYRIILYVEGDASLLLHLDRHDAAYRWAEGRRAGRHSVTGEFQLVATVEVIEEKVRTIQRLVESPPPPLLENFQDAYLLSLGVPASHLPWLRELRSEEDLLAGEGHLPQELFERLLDLCSGQLVPPPAPIPQETPLDTRPIAGGRFRLLAEEELQAALAGSMLEWMLFLHPAQRGAAFKNYRGAAAVSGSAGTGKTVVALHRAVHLAGAGHHVLLTTFSRSLCMRLKQKVALLAGPLQERIEVHTLHQVAVNLLQQAGLPAHAASPSQIEHIIGELQPYPGGKGAFFLLNEWNKVIQSQGLMQWSQYRDARRVGMQEALPIGQRQELWPFFERLRAALALQGLTTWEDMLVQAETLLDQGLPSPYQAVVVDEVQDLRTPGIRLVKALSRNHGPRLMLVGDSGQRIYPGGFSLSALGIETRGRTTRLRINYRTTLPIKRLAERVRQREAEDWHGGGAGDGKAISLRGGLEPLRLPCHSQAEEEEQAVRVLRQWAEKGLAFHEMALFCRTRKALNRFLAALERSGIPGECLSDTKMEGSNGVRLGTLHAAKGLEFRAVLVVDLGEKSLPNRKAVEQESSEAGRREVLRQERALLYVAMTRAREELALSWHGRESVFLRE